MTTYIKASELVKEGVTEAINIEKAKRQQFKEEKEYFNDSLVKKIITELKERIKNNSTKPEEWYIECILDKETLKKWLNKLYKELSLFDSPYNIRLKKLKITECEKTIKYIDTNKIEERLNEAGYTVIKKEVKYKKFFCIPYKFGIIHRIYIKN